MSFEAHKNTTFNDFPKYFFSVFTTQVLTAEDGRPKFEKKCNKKGLEFVGLPTELTTHEIIELASSLDDAPFGLYATHMRWAGISHHTIQATMTRNTVYVFGVRARMMLHANSNCVYVVENCIPYLESWYVIRVHMEEHRTCVNTLIDKSLTRLTVNVIAHISSYPDIVIIFLFDQPALLSNQETTFRCSQVVQTRCYCVRRLSARCARDG